MFAVVLLMGLLAIGWAYRAIRPPPPKICGSPGGPPITAPRIKLRDGRNFAYKERGVPAQVAKYKIIFVHGLSACRHSPVILKSLPQVLYCVLYLHRISKLLCSILKNLPQVLYCVHSAKKYIYTVLFSFIYIEFLNYSVLKEILFRNLLKNLDYTFCLLTNPVMEKVIHIQNKH